MDGTMLLAYGPLALAMLAAGLAAGVLAGFLGVGGGIVLVPVLFQAFGFLGIDEAVRMHLAVGTSLASIVPTSIRSVTKHDAKGAVDRPVLIAWAPAIVIGVILGALIADRVDGTVLTLVFAVLALSVAAQMAFLPDRLRLGEAMPGEPVRSSIGGTIGLASTLMGIGGGTFGVTVMTLYGMPIHRAIGTASGLGLIISVPGMIGFILAGQGASGLPPASLGYVNALALAFIIPMTWLAVPWGVALAHRISRAALRRAFAGFLGLNAVLMIAESVTR